MELTLNRCFLNRGALLNRNCPIWRVLYTCYPAIGTTFSIALYRAGPTIVKYRNRHFQTAADLDRQNGFSPVKARIPSLRGEFPAERVTSPASGGTADPVSAKYRVRPYARTCFSGFGL
jgi:hypothetical protein